LDGSKSTAEGMTSGKVRIWEKSIFLVLLVVINTTKMLQVIQNWCNITSKIKNYVQTKYIFHKTK
jgi:hypothetical protein